MSKISQRAVKQVIEVNSKPAELKGKCELCGCSDGNLSFGLFNYICTPCQKKANETLRRAYRYLWYASFNEVVEQLKQKD
jgi:hypothetical protein